MRKNTGGGGGGGRERKDRRKHYFGLNKVYSRTCKNGQTQSVPEH